MTRPGAGGPDPDRVLTQADLARELTLLREREGLTLRQVSRDTQIPLSTVGGYFAGRHLPPASQPDLLPRILAACGERDPRRLDRWQRALTRARRAPGKRTASAAAPYRGLARFELADAEWFFGREELTLHLTRLAAGPGPAGTPLAVVGPSGSGKSSLLRAGLLARLAAGRPEAGRAAVFTPGAAPLTALAAALCRLADGNSPAEAGAAEASPAKAGAAEASPAEAGPAKAGAAKAGAAEASPAKAGAAEAWAVEAALRAAPANAAQLLPGRGRARPAIIADQFEEVFVAGADEAQRQAFIAALCALSEEAVVVLGLRADFYGSALRYPELARALQERQIAVGPMTAEQLRRAIVEPARKAGAEVEDGLVELLLRDLRPAGAAGPDGHDAGALPLLSHALLATWTLAQGGRLTIADYRASGGIHDAVARSAEEAYRSLDEAGQRVARRFFTQLVQVTDSARETRARLPLRDLPDGADTGRVSAALERFVERRLVTLDAGTAEISHEALLTAWPRLRAWIEADRGDIRTRRMITAAAQTWEDGDREPGSLLRGGPLVVARDWVADPSRRQTLSQLARVFVDASVAEDTAQRDAQRRAARRLRQLAAGLAVAMLVTTGLAGYAFDQRQLATRAERVAQSRSVAIEAGQLRAEDPALAAQLSLAAYRIAPTADARSALLASSAAPAAARIRDSAGVVQAVALSPARTLLAVAAADGSLRLWNLSRPGHPVARQRLLAAGGRSLYSAAFSPDGRLLAAAGADGLLRLWRVGPEGATPLGGPLAVPAATIYSVAFAPDSGVLAAGSADGAVRLWNVAGPGRPAPLAALPGPGAAVMSVAFAPGGEMLAAGGADKNVRLWNVSTPTRPRPLGRPLTGPADTVFAVAFSPDGRTLAAGSKDSSVWLWNLASPLHPVRAAAPLAGAQDWVNGLAFSPDGRTLAAASSDDRVLLWDVASGALRAALPNPQPATSVTWAGPHLLISGDADGYARIWRVPAPTLMTGGAVNDLAYGPGGELAAAGAQLQVWSAADHTLRASVPAGGPAGTMVNAVAFSPGGKLLAAGYSDGQVRLWRDGPALVPASPPQVASTTGMVEYAAFAPGGRVLATAGDDGTVRLWSVSPSGGLRLLSTIADAHNYVFSVAFSADGRVLAAASADDLTRLWNVADPAHPARLGSPLAGPSSYAISVAFSPRGRTLAVGSADKTVRLWDVADPARPTPLGSPLTGPGGYVYSVAFAPGGRTLAGGSTDGSVWLWDVSDPAHPAALATIAGLDGHIYSVAFSPSGRQLAATGSGGDLWLWDTSLRDAARAVCGLPGQPLSRAEWQAYVPGRPYAPPCAG